MTTVKVNNLHKSYGKVKAIQDINFEVEESEIFGLIGPDGAGKTTIFRILTSLILPDEGSAQILDYDVVNNYKKIRQIIGYMPGRFSLYQDLTVEENLNFFASVFGTTIEENYDLIKDIYVQIEPFKKRRAGALSGGMKQKLALSCALIHKPEILILDEPTTGVDAVSRKEFWEMLRKLKDKNITILVSTPYMDEASLCDRVALIQNGKIMQIDTPVRIVEKFGKELYSVRTDNIYKLLQSLRNYEHTNSVFPFGQYLHFTSLEPSADVDVLDRYLKNEGHKNIEIQKIKPNIEDCFMALMT
ncbi:MAG: ABC transporter ATP-binding protein [Bacteroidales bacterium]|nr:ABC transporter ATP-binding protein [Bacteroidales bacterium]